MEITPVIPADKNVIKGYGDMAFKVNERKFVISIIISPSCIEEWDVTGYSSISVDSLAPVFNFSDDIEILLIGCGEAHMPLDPAIHRHFTSKGIGVEIMTTGAACRTYNVLLAEGRNVAAALVLV